MRDRGTVIRCSRFARVRLVAAMLGASLLEGASTHRDGGPLQRVWQSDVRVRSLVVTRGSGAAPVMARVTVAADSDDARGVRVEILLPVGVGVAGTSRGCRASTGPVMSLAARVTCDLGTVRLRDQREVWVTTTGRPSARGRLRFAAFVVSDTPDPEPENNFGEGDDR